jgi:hypothetical protein
MFYKKLWQNDHGKKTDHRKDHRATLAQFTELPRHAPSLQVNMQTAVSTDATSLSCYRTSLCQLTPQIIADAKWKHSLFMNDPPSEKRCLVSVNGEVLTMTDSASTKAKPWIDDHAAVTTSIIEPHCTSHVKLRSFFWLSRPPKKKASEDRTSSWRERVLR